MPSPQQNLQPDLRNSSNAPHNEKTRSNKVDYFGAIIPGVEFTRDWKPTAMSHPLKRNVLEGIKFLF